MSDYWTLFAEDARTNGHAPLYARLAEGIRDDEELLAVAAKSRRGQPYANMILAAAHYLLLRGARHPLRRFYANLNDGIRDEGADPFPQFRDFVLAHREEIEVLIATHATNTNEVGRSAILHAGFRAVAAEAGTPLALIEIGPSAGLNMLWDRYRVRYRAGDAVYDVGPDDCGLVIECELRGGARPPVGETPAVASRVGLERNPVDLSDADQRDWLRALVWPDNVARFERLEKALAIRVANPPEIHAGSALDLLTDAIAQVPETSPICVYHTFVTYQFTEEMRETLDDLLTVAGLRRPVWRFSVEGRLGHDTPLQLYRYRDGTRDKRIFGRAHSHGGWLEWYADPVRA
jgi:hypothetical protein